jgi:hypothetical protein
MKAIMQQHQQPFRQRYPCIKLVNGEILRLELGDARAGKLCGRFDFKMLRRPGKIPPHPFAHSSAKPLLWRLAGHPYQPCDCIRKVAGGGQADGCKEAHSRSSSQ